MNRISEVLGFLRGQSEYVSGDYISSQLHLSRTAVWKYVRQLRGLGYVVERLKGRGYLLLSTPDRLFPWEVEHFLSTDMVGRRIEYRDSIDSTNQLAYRLALDGASEGTCVIAETQKAGRGRLQRKWFSPHGRNLYLSVILRPALHPSHVYPITFLSCLAVYDTLLALGLQPALKWPNDVLVNGKKICGTLLELSTEADMVRFVVVGIGLNVNMRKAEMSVEIRDKATSTLIETRKFFERARVCGILLNTLEQYYHVLKRDGARSLCNEWEKRADIKGKHMEIAQGSSLFRGIAQGIDEDGALLLNNQGTVRRIIAGDVAF